MKPITDDVVFSILEGLEKRERRKRGLRKVTKPALSSRLLRPGGNKRIISLDIARQARRTVSGVFCYVAKH